jgi:hypothetical protein
MFPDQKNFIAQIASMSLFSISRNGLWGLQNENFHNVVLLLSLFFKESKLILCF